MISAYPSDKQLHTAPTLGSSPSADMGTTGKKRKLDDWEPKQVELKGAIDLRHAALGPRGYKLKPIKSGTSSLLKVQHAAAQLQQQADEPQGMDTDAAEPYAAPAVKRQRAEGVAYRNVSGKSWKEAPSKRASADKNAIVNKHSSWEKKMQEKAQKKAFQEQKAAALDAIKAKRKAAAQHRQAVKDRKKANQEKSVQVQQITNAATLKKMMKSKKQRKMLRTADTT